MKFIILLIAVATLSFSLFAQDLNMTNVQEKKELKKEKGPREIHPLEISIGFGGNIDISDSILRTIKIFNPAFPTLLDTVIYQSFAIDTIGPLNNQISIDVSKQIGSWQLGISTNYMFKSSEISGYSKDYTYAWGPYIDTYTLLDSRSSYNLKLFRLNFFADYLILDKKKCSVYLGGGFGYMQKSFSNLTFQNQIFERVNVNTSETTIEYQVWESNLIYKHSSPILTSKAGVGYRISSKLRVNLDLSLNSPLNRTISLEGTYKNYESSNQFLGDWQEIYPHSNVFYTEGVNGEQVEFSRATLELQNPIQIGLLFSVSYSL